MADFCKQCAIDMFGEDTGNLRGLITKAQFEMEGEDAVAASGICEGCGANYFDHEGARVRPSDDLTKWVHY